VHRYPKEYRNDENGKALNNFYDLSVGHQCIIRSALHGTPWRRESQDLAKPCLLKILRVALPNP
jgi:hypothetical protein